MEDKYRKNLTEGNVNTELFKFAMPFLFAQLLQALYVLTDTIIVGRYLGDVGITAMNNSSIIPMMLTGLITGFSLSGTVLVAQYVGAKEEDEAKKTMGTIFTIFIYFSIVITTLGLVFTNKIVELLNTPSEAAEGARNYLSITFWGTVFICGYNSISAVLRGLGDSKRPFYFVIVSTLLNVVLDILFIGPLEMGTRGAALATVISQATAFILVVYTLYKQKFIFDFKRESFKIDKTKLKLIFKIGLPSAVQSVSVNTAYLFVISTINTFGLAASTAVGMGSKIDTFAILPINAVSQAVASMAGQNLGAGKYDRARETMFAGMRMTFVYGIAVYILVRIFPREILGIFGCTAAAVDIGVLYLKYETISYIFNSVALVENGLANGSGNSIFSFFNMFGSLVVSRVTLVYLFVYVFKLGLIWIFIAMGIAQCLGVVGGTIFYLSKRWRRTIIKEQ